MNLHFIIKQIVIPVRPRSLDQSSNDGVKDDPDQIIDKGQQNENRNKKAGRS
ncbi:hypothetical protein GCM10011418_17010 [Sphingobacterium alkalisoli]|nr:hypothetical protein GCM10011418_17010 [Sphingobacterium alkalisoli]